MKKRARDSQRSRYYKAVRVLDQFDEKLPEMADINQYLTEVLGRAPITRRYGRTVERHRFNVRDGRGYGIASVIIEENAITFPRRSRSKALVLRVAAYLVHHYASRYLGGGTRTSELSGHGQAWHSWQYCAIVMDLVRYGMGASAADALRAAFTANRVQWTKPATRTLTPEQQARSVEQGKKIGALMRDRKARIRFSKSNPSAVLVDPDTFADEVSESLYQIWRPR